MTTTLAKTDLPASIDTVPRPFLRSILGFGAYWTAPEYTRKEIEKYGGRMVVDVPFVPRLLITARPEDCRTLFTDRTGSVKFGEALRRMAPHEMLFGSEMIDWWNGANHAELRRKVTPAFNGKALAGYEEAIVAAAERRVAQWPVGRPVRFMSLMRTLARDVIMSVVFGVTESERRDRLERQLIALDHTIASPGMVGRYALAVARGGKWPSFAAMDRVNAAIDAVTIDEIAYRRANPATEERKDCLEVFLRIQAADADDTMDDRMIAIFQRLLLIAGYETTAVTLAWVAERIVRHPDVLAELDTTLAEGNTDYLDAVVTETMRLRPSLPVTARYVERDFVMNDLLVPAGTVILVGINAIQKRADIYPEPERFDPERFRGVRPDPHHWLPFGGGAHRCLGGAFAMFEARVLLQTILKHRRFEPDTAPGERQDQHRNILLLPRNGATVTMHAR